MLKPPAGMLFSFVGLGRGLERHAQQSRPMNTVEECGRKVYDDSQICWLQSSVRDIIQLQSRIEDTISTWWRWDVGPNEKGSWHGFRRQNYRFHTLQVRGRIG